MAKKRKFVSDNKTKKSRNEVKTCGEYYVEEIQDWAVDRAGRLMFLLKWEDYPEEDNSWEFETHMTDCQDIRERFSLTVNGRHPPKYSWHEFDKFVDCLKKIIDNDFEDIAVLNKLSPKKYSFSELKNNNVIQEIKSKVEIEFSKLIINKFSKRTNVERNDARDLVQKVCKTLKIDKTIGSVTQLFEFVDRRKDFHKRLESWAKLQNAIIAKEGEGLAISLANDVDIEIPQLERYITKCIIDRQFSSAFDKLIVKKQKPLHSCECKDCYEERHDCCTSVIGFPMCYNSKGLLTSSRVVNTIFECNHLCKCGINCSNRVIQRGRQTRLEIFRTENASRGWGVRAVDPIARGQFVTKYTGEVISLSEAEQRPTTYLYDLSPQIDTSDVEYTYLIDANRYGNIGRFFNHSCEPNCRAAYAWTDNHDKNLPLVVLFAIKPIRANDELTYDYGMGLIECGFDNDGHLSDDDLSTDSGAPSSHIESVDKSDSGSVDGFLDLSFSQRNKNISFKKIECKCGSKKCRKFLYS